MKNIQFQSTFYILYVPLDQKGLNELPWLDRTLKIFLFLTKMNFTFIKKWVFIKKFYM